MTFEITRREMLRGLAGAGALGALASCGVSGGTHAAASQSPLPARTGSLSIATWPLYIDTDETTKRRPTVDKFHAATGITVNYKEPIGDNLVFFGTIRDALANSKPTGWDVIVISEWLVAKMVRLGYLEELHLDALPNFTANADPMYLDPVYDRGSKHCIPWQSGITGIAYNPKLTGRELDSFADLLDPAFKGKVGMFDEMRDTVNLALLGSGVDPQTAKTSDVEMVVTKLRKQRNDGIVRDYYDNGYTDALAKGDLAVSMAWSGDISQLQTDNPDLKFIVPKEGGIIWTDTMAIPNGAANVEDAHEWMNFVYKTDIAAEITVGTEYVSPVPAGQMVLRASSDSDDIAVADSPFIYPDAATMKRLHRYRVLTEQEETEWNNLFDPLVQG